MTEPAEMFGQYRLEALLGRGGMGEVHRAYDTVRKRLVALKRLPPALAADADFRARFQKEAALAARLHEPHIIPIHDYGEIDGRIYIDMRLVEGSDLSVLLADHGPLDASRAVNIVSQVAAALDVAHAQSLVHRDIKPGNLLITPGTVGETGQGEFVYVADFGIARAMSHGSTSFTATSVTVGSLDYMAPERFTGGHGDHRVDVYSLGCLLFETLTARRPFPVEGLPAMIYAHLHTPPPRPSEHVDGLPSGLDAVVARAMAKSADGRYASAGELAADARAALKAVAGQRPVAEPAPFAGDLAPPSAPAAAPEPDPAESPTTDIRRNGLAGASTFVPRPAVAAAATLPPPGWNPPYQQPHYPLVTPIAPPARPARQRWPVVLAAVLLVLTLIGSGVALTLVSSSSSDVRTEPVLTAGDNPFMPSVGGDKVGVTPPPRAGGEFSGATSGLYGGTLNNAACNPAAMIDFLERNPAKGAAWAEVQGIAPSQLRSYIGGLTPALLRSDTRVTNHGFDDGKATTLHSVLQAGTAVLVDEVGVPRARCYCGNPLTPPQPLSQPRYSGASWSGFSPRAVTVIVKSDVVIDEFTIVDPFTGEAFGRPRGTSGERDLSRSPSPVPSPSPVEQIPTLTVEPPVSVRPLPHQPLPSLQQPSTPPTSRPKPQPQPPKITGHSTYQEGPLIYLVVTYTDADDDAEGFGFRGVNDSRWEREQHSFDDRSHGQVSPGKVTYPFNHRCDGEFFESDVQFWIYDSLGKESDPIVVHLACEESGGT